MRSRSAVIIPGLAAARAVAKARDPNLTPEYVAEQIGASRRQLGRYEQGAHIPLDKALQLEALYGTTFPEAHPNKAPARSIATTPAPVASSSDTDKALQGIDKLTALYDARRIQGASPAELKRLRDSTIEALCMVLFADMPGDPQAQRRLAAATFELRTRVTAPPVEPEIPRAVTAKRSSAKKRL